MPPIAQGATPQPRLQALQRLFFGRANQFSTQSFSDRADTLAQITRDNGDANSADIFELVRDHAHEIDLLDGREDGFITPQNLATLAGRGRLGTSTTDIDVSDFIRMPRVAPPVPEQLPAPGAPNPNPAPKAGLPIPKPTINPELRQLWELSRGSG